MKKRTSIVALGLRLTAGWVAAIILLTCALQVWRFLGTQPLWTDQNYRGVAAFAWVLDEAGVALVGKLSFVLILVAVVLPCGSLRNRNVYTLRRLRLSENRVTAIWALVFSGYFLIGWGVQLALVLWMYSRYALATGSGSMELFVEAYRSPYFHTLLPLAEGWGYVRNAAICLGWGAMGSLMARYMRHEGKPILGAVLVIATGFLLPRDMATAGNDILLCLLLAAMVGGQIYLIKGGGEDED